ncbi:unnamed protein product [Effrenium voratum]|nr:unnamed protein product [Effrenium voratum]
MPVKRDIYGPEVVELWRHDVDSPRAGPLAESRVSGDAEEALDRFNAYIRGPLQAAVVESIGHEAHVPYYLCVVAFLPMNFYSLVNTLGCDSGPCETSARNAGFDSVESYLGTQALAWLLCLLLTFPLTHPVLLRCVRLAMSCTEGHHLKTFLTALCCPIAYAYSYICGGAIWGLAFATVQNYSPAWLAALVFYLTFLVAQAFLLFRSPLSATSYHTDASQKYCCSGRQIVSQYEEVRPMLPSAFATSGGSE